MGASRCELEGCSRGRRLLRSLMRVRLAPRRSRTIRARTEQSGPLLCITWSCLAPATSRAGSVDWRSGPAAVCRYSLVTRLRTRTWSFSRVGIATTASSNSRQLFSRRTWFKQEYAGVRLSPGAGNFPFAGPAQVSPHPAPSGSQSWGSPVRSEERRTDGLGVEPNVSAESRCD